MWLVAAAFAASNPDVSVERGVFDAPFSVVVSASTAGESVVCSTDRSDPARPCKATIDISATTTLRTQELASDGSVSEIISYTYVFPADVAASAVMDRSVTDHATYGPLVVKTLSELPSVSLLTAASISTTEQAASAEWIDPAGPDMQVNCGVSLSGTTSLGYPKNSVRLYFREEYGESTVEFDFWGEDAPGVRPSLDQDALSLRSGHDSVFYLGAQGQYTRNFWMDETQLEMGHLAPHGRFAHLYVNGEYRGIYHVRERFNAGFMANYLGGTDEEYESVNGGAVTQGSGSAWGNILAAQGDWDALEPWLDRPAFLDYMVLSFYAANAWDWSYNHNWYASGPSSPNEGGYRFESSDCDICIYYDYTTNILSNPGPSYIYYYLLLEGNADFKVALADAIHRNLEAGGPLTAENAGARYAGIAQQAEEAVVAESARWGGGWWTRDNQWVPERNRLIDSWFPYRTDEMLKQFRDAGWYPISAPEFSRVPGMISAGDSVSVSFPTATRGELWATIDGSDPRLSGGAVGDSATEGENEFGLEHSTLLRARVRQGDTWGPLAEAFYELDESSPIVLNEWNAVDEGEGLNTENFDGSGADDAFGAIPGNGGDWIELLFIEDTDLRGWTVSLSDLRGPRGSLVFSEASALAELRAGTILTVAKDLPEDAAYDPDNGDWRLHLRAGTEGSGTYISATPFDTSSHNFQITIRDASGTLKFGPAGEGISPRDGIGGHEVGILATTPDASLRRTSVAWAASTRSTFGAANQWDGGEQDLSALRGQLGGIYEPGDAETPSSNGTGNMGPGCGCQTSEPPGILGLSVPFVALLARFRRRGFPKTYATHDGFDYNWAPCALPSSRSSPSP